MLETNRVRWCAVAWLLNSLAGSVIGAEANRPAAPLAQLGESSSKSSEPAADPLSKAVLTAADFELIGGWRVPAATRQPDDRSLAWGNGGLAVRLDGAAWRFYTTHHNHLGGPIQELIAAEPPGAVTTQVTAWPLLQVGEYLGDLYRIVREAHPDTAQPECTGVFLDGKRIITTGRAAYAVPPPEGPFLGVDGKACGVDGGSPQLLGGGLCDIPRWFADQFLEGKSLGVGLGGYCSGQGSSVGPSLFACARELSESTPSKPLLQFGALGTTTRRSANAAHLTTRTPRTSGASTPMAGRATGRRIACGQGRYGSRRSGKPACATGPSRDVASWNTRGRRRRLVKRRRSGCTSTHRAISPTWPKGASDLTSRGGRFSNGTTPDWRAASQAPAGSRSRGRCSCCWPPRIRTVPSNCQ